MIELSQNVNGYLLVWVLNIGGIGTIIKHVTEKEAIENFPGLCRKIKLQSNKANTADTKKRG